MCARCEKEQDIEQFGKSKKGDGRQYYCKSCKQKIYARYRRRFMRQIIVARYKRKTRNALFVLEHLKTHPCVDCGERDPLVLTFDHVRGKKKDDVSALVNDGVSLLLLSAEIEKCDVRCSNCHVRRTSKQFGFIKNKLLASVV